MGYSPASIRAPSRAAGPSTDGISKAMRGSWRISMSISRGATIRTTAARLPP